MTHKRLTRIISATIIFTLAATTTFYAESVSGQVDVIADSIEKGALDLPSRDDDTSQPVAVVLEEERLHLEEERLRKEGKENALTEGDAAIPHEPVEEKDEKSLSELVQQAVDSAEAASEAAGVEYYGKERTGMLGNKLWYADIGALVPDDSDFDVGFAISSGFNIPISKHFDFNLGLGYSHQEGTYGALEKNYYTYTDYYYTYSWWGWPTLRSRQVTDYEYRWVTYDIEIDTLSFLADLYFSFRPDKRFNPFVHGGGFYLDQDISIASYGASVSSAGLIFGAGAEMKTSDKTTCVLSVSRVEADDAEDTSISGLFAYWYAHNHAMRFSASYSTEYESYTASLGWMYGY